MSTWTRNWEDLTGTKTYNEYLRQKDPFFKDKECVETISLLLSHIDARLPKGCYRIDRTFHVDTAVFPHPNEWETPPWPVAYLDEYSELDLISIINESTIMAIAGVPVRRALDHERHYDVVANYLVTNDIPDQLYDVKLVLLTGDQQDDEMYVAVTRSDLEELYDYMESDDRVLRLASTVYAKTMHYVRTDKILRAEISPMTQAKADKFRALHTAKEDQQ